MFDMVFFSKVRLVSIPPDYEHDRINIYATISGVSNTWFDHGVKLTVVRIGTTISRIKTFFMRRP